MKRMMFESHLGELDLPVGQLAVQEVDLVIQLVYDPLVRLVCVRQRNLQSDMASKRITTRRKLGVRLFSFQTAHPNARMNSGQKDDRDSRSPARGKGKHGRLFNVRPLRDAKLCRPFSKRPGDTRYLAAENKK